VALKEFIQAARDPLSLTMLLGIPTGLLLLFGYALSFDVRHIALGVECRDPGPESRALIEAFTQSGYFDLTAALPAGSDIAVATEQGRVEVVLVIPESYSDDLAAGRPAPVQLLLDGADASRASTILGYAKAIVAQANVPLRERWLDRAGVRADPPIESRPRVWYNPELESTPFLVPGLIGFILMITGVLATALSVVREKERGTLDQLRLTPLHGLQLLVGKTLPYLVISLAATGLFLIAARYLFDVPVRGPLWALFVATLIYLVGALGFGLFVSSIVNSQAMAFQVGVVASMLPAIFLSGFVFPISAAPLPVRLITYIVPARYYLVVIRGVILKGTDLAPYGRQLLFLGIYAVVVLTIATLRLTRREV
jgi:ABC-2 type transport system permease protein